MERAITKQLIEWKESPDRKPLLLTGVRQCGKTYLCKQFGEQHFDDVAYFYFEGNRGLSSVFDYDFDVERILDELGNVIRQKPIIPGKTLVIFDEIQSCPKAITSLKYFCENKRELHIICAGSLLGVSLKRDGISFPVGKVDRMRMYPMNFSEFLRADGYGALCDGIQKFELRRELSDLYTQNLEKELKYYYIVGGMPEAVQK
ncbi:MAG: AAA family ATPase, partial [Clostridiales bacterium]|nr:AAA family ATPase [Clostridiales bacterium]